MHTTTHVACRVVIADRGHHRHDLATAVREAGFVVKDSPRQSADLRELGLLEMDVLLEIDNGERPIADFFPWALQLAEWSAFVSMPDGPRPPTLVLARREGRDAAGDSANGAIVTLLRKSRMRAAPSPVHYSSAADPGNAHTPWRRSAKAGAGDTLADMAFPLPAPDPARLLVGKVAHDLNNLITVIRGNSQLLMSRALTREEVRLLAADIDKAGLQAALVTGRLLEAGRQTHSGSPQTGSPQTASGSVPNVAHSKDVQTMASESVPPAAATTLLLVEDEAMVRSIFRRILQEAGYFVLEAADGAGAIGLAEQFPHPIHLLITDLDMPNVTGIALAEHMSSLHPETQVLLLSGHHEAALPGQAPRPSRSLFCESLSGQRRSCKK